MQFCSKKKKKNLFSNKSKKPQGHHSLTICLLVSKKMSRFVFVSAGGEGGGGLQLTVSWEERPKGGGWTAKALKGGMMKVLCVG